MIDGHLHVFRRPSEQYPRGVDALAPADREALAPDLLKLMDRAGVQRAVLVPLGPEDEYVIECLNQYPDRFYGVSVFEPDRPSPLHQLAQKTAHPAVRGIRMSGFGARPARDVRISDTFPMLQEMEERGIVLWWYGPPQELTALRDLLEHLPGLRVAMNHLGFCPEAMTVDDFGRPRVASIIPPATLPGVVRLAEFPGVHVMLSGAYAFSSQAYPYLDLAPVVRTLLDAFGARRMFWASDYPWIAREPGYEEMAKLPGYLLGEISPFDLEEIMGGTAARLLG